MTRTLMSDRTSDVSVHKFKYAHSTQNGDHTLEKIVISHTCLDHSCNSFMNKFGHLQSLRSCARAGTYGAPFSKFGHFTRVQCALENSVISRACSAL